MSSKRHQLLNRDHSNTVNNSNGQQPYKSSTKKHHIDVEEWLSNAKLLDYRSVFVRERITIEELLSFTDTELLSVADETLHLSVLHRKRFVNAMDQTNQQISLNRDHIYSRSSSNLKLLTNINTTNDPSPIRPSSPSLSIHSAHSSPMDNSKYSTNRNKYNTNYNNYALNGTEQSPLITTKYNHHHYYHRLPSIPSKNIPKLSQRNGKDNIGILFKARGKTHRFGDHRKRRHSTPETEDMSNISQPTLKVHKSIPNSLHGSSSNTSESSEYIDSAPRSAHSINSIQRMRQKRKNVKKKKHKYKRDKTRSNSTISISMTKKVNKESKQTAAVNEMVVDKRSKTYDRQFKIIRSTPKHMALIAVRPSRDDMISEDEEIDSTKVTKRRMQRMRLNSSESEMSSNNEAHSVDEKWDELNDITVEEQENMKTISVLLQENKADTNQIEHGIKVLHNYYSECERQIGEYFDDLQDRLKERNIQILNVLESVRCDKEKDLNKKIRRLQQHKKHVLKQKYLCDEVLNDDTNDVQQRQHKIAQLKDIALVNGSDVVDVDVDEMECLIEMEFDTQRRDDFYDNICLIRECRVPQRPCVMIKIIDDACIALKIVIMTSKQKKAIQHDPSSNHSKNVRIEEIEIQYIQCKTNDIQEIYVEFDKLNENDKLNKRKSHDNCESKDTESEDHNNENICGIKRILIDGNTKLKRIHEVRVDDLMCGYCCYVRGRCKNINGWSVYSEAMDAGLSTIDNDMDLIYDIDNSSHSYGIEYISSNKCVVFDQTKEHNIAVADIVIDKKEYDTFEWKYIVEFDSFEDKKKKKKKKNNEEMNDNDKEGVCMGFISYPLQKYMKYTHAILGRSGTQYGLFVTNGSDSAHAYFTRNSSTHHTCSIKLNKKVENRDEFKILCDMKERKCDIYYNEQLLIDVFGTKIPNKVIPAVSGYVIEGSVSCALRYISSTQMTK